MRIRLRNNPAEFRPDRIWNDGALGFFVRGHQEEVEEVQQQEQDE